jgi:hypothetical protein
MINTESHVSTTNSVSGAEAVEQGDSRWFINISYAHKIEVQYPVEVLDRTDDHLIVRYLSTGTVATFDHAMIRELPFDKKAPRLSRREAELYWSRPS